MVLRPLAGAPPGTETLGFPVEPDTQSESGTSAGAALGAESGRSEVPGLNQIGALLDDLRKAIQHNERWSLRQWVEGAKLLVIATDVHNLKGDDYENFAATHLPLAGNKRSAYDLYLLGYAREGQPANGDLIIAECEAQAKLRQNYVWPHWRKVMARLRKEAKERDQGDGIPAGGDVEGEEDEVTPDIGRNSNRSTRN